eukprot:TRINITY_DN20889_c0_g4_i2.p1 TRINITY_DN20889_c0_g4~~TRINITY_DN20889_c0_g4_i2.p1  ORF type:complete len:477 (-),score=50.26 TRINITY_DN20889_c0_g4_i2:90-1520(-)
MADTAICPPPQQPRGKLALLNRTFGRPFRHRASLKTAPGTSSSSQSPASALPRVHGSVGAKGSASSSNHMTPAPASAPSAARASPGLTSLGGRVDEWEAIRLAERDFVLAHDTSNTDIWYLVDVGWLSEWKRFVSQAGPLPGALRSEALIDRRTGRPKPGLLPIHHYRGVNAEVWTFWAQRYGGGPPVRRRRLDLYAPPVDDVPVFPETPVALPGHTATSCLTPVVLPQALTPERPEKAPESPEKVRASWRHFGSLRTSRSSTRRSGSSCFSTRSGTTSTTASGGASGSRTDSATSEEGSPSSDSGGWVFFVKECNACIVSQPMDGSCLFHSLSYGLDDETDAASLRLEISTFIAENPDLAIAGTALRDWVKFDSGGGVDAYAADVAGGTWGGGIEMEVFARLKKTHVHVYEATQGGYRRICCFDGGTKATRTLSVLYRERGSHGMEHYDALLVDNSAGQWLPRSSFESPGAPGGA